MRQVLRRGFGEMVVEEVPIPSLGSHHVLVQNRTSLISSGTESASIHGSVVKEVAQHPGHIKTILDVAKVQGPVRTAAEVLAKFRDLAVLGYSGAGLVSEAHPSVTTVSPGERVAYGGEGTGHAEYVTTGERLVATVPENVPFEEAAFTTLGSIALNAVRTADLDVGDRVLVLGLGIVGQLVAQLAAVAGARVYVSDLRADRVALAGSLTDVVGLTTADSPEEIRALTDGVGVDCVIIAAAAHSDVPARIALSSVRDRGRIVIVGAVDVAFPWEEMYLKEVRVLMARAYGPGSYDPDYERKGRDYPLPYVRWTEQRNMQEFLRLLSTGQVQVAPLISHRFELEQAPEAYRTVMESGDSMGVVLRYATPEGSPPEGQRRHVVSPLVARSGRVGVALIGAGNIARWAHVPSLRRAGAKLVAVYSKSGVRAKAYASRFRASYCTTEYDAVLEDPDIDAVVIATRNHLHAQQALAALRAGKHVFVEKPLAITTEECVDLLKIRESSDRILTVGFNRRYAPSYMAVKEALRGSAGPHVINCRVNSPGISGSYWMADPSIGGAILGEACHFTDLMYWLLESEPIRVHAYSLDQRATEPVGLNNLAATFQFANGAVAGLTYCTVGSPASAGERLEVFMPGRGVLAEDFKLFETRGKRRRRRTSFFAKKGYEAQMHRFIRAIESGERIRPDIDDGVRSTMACIRMIEATRTGEPRSIDWESII